MKAGTLEGGGRVNWGDDDCADDDKDDDVDEMMIMMIHAHEMCLS